MKHYLIAFIIVAVVVAWFSFYGDTTPYNFPPKQGWAFWGGTEPIVGSFFDGEENAEADEKSNTFTLEQAETKEAQPLETEETEQESNFTVSVKQKPVWEYILYGVAITLSIEVVALGIVAIVLWIKSRK